MISFEQAKLMKELGLTQKRHKNAKYYVTPDIIMDFEAIHDLKDAKHWFLTRGEVNVNWMEHFTYIPELIDLIGPQSYDLTLDAAVYHFIDNHKQAHEDNLKRSEEVINNHITDVGKMVPEPEKPAITDPTLGGIEKLKQAMINVKENATQSPTTKI